VNQFATRNKFSKKLELIQFTFENQLNINWIDTCSNEGHGLSGCGSNCNEVSIFHPFVLTTNSTSLLNAEISHTIEQVLINFWFSKKIKSFNNNNFSRCGYYLHIQSRQLLLINQGRSKKSPKYDSSQPINDSYDSLNDYYEKIK
jgi:hypothetical protein